jgi:hypothetical protein
MIDEHQTIKTNGVKIQSGVQIYGRSLGEHIVIFHKVLAFLLSF